MRRSCRLQTKQNSENVKEESLDEKNTLQGKSEVKSEERSNPNKDIPLLLNQIKKTSRNSKKVLTTPAKSTCKKPHGEVKLSTEEDDVVHTNLRSSCKKNDDVVQVSTDEEQDVLDTNLKKRIATPARNSHKKKDDVVQVSTEEEEDVLGTNLKKRIATPARNSHKKKDDVVQISTAEEEDVLGTNLKKRIATPVRNSRKKKHDKVQLSTVEEEEVLDTNLKKRITTHHKNDDETQLSMEDNDVLVRNLKKRIATPAESGHKKHHNKEQLSTEDDDDDDEPLVALKVCELDDVADKEMKHKHKRKTVVCKTNDENLRSDEEGVGHAECGRPSEVEKVDKKWAEDGQKKDGRPAEEVDVTDKKDASCEVEDEKLQSDEEDVDPGEHGRLAEEIEVTDEKKDSSCDNVGQNKDNVRNDGSVSDSDSSVIDFNTNDGRNDLSPSFDKKKYNDDEEKLCNSSMLVHSDVVSVMLHIEDASIQQDKSAVDNHVEIEPAPVNVIENPVPMKVITCQKSLKRTSFNLDRSKYENSYLNKFADNPLMQSLCELKNNNLFQDHMKMKRSHVQEKGDVLSLDNVTLVSDTPAQNNRSRLSSCIQTAVTHDLYIDTSTAKSNQIDTNKTVEKLMKKSVLADDLESMERAPKLFKSKNSIKVQSKKKRDETAGKGWYNLPKTEVTDKIKNDLQLIKMRNVLDSKHHYKRNDSNKLPKYFQMGTIVEGAHEFYSARVPKKKRKSTMVDELLDDAEFRRKNKQKYIEIRKKQMSGGKGFYKKLKNKGKKAWEKT